jgi:GT2 family glycosyltransferase/polysaccharide pyruvyl transferase WcaK-like protein/glycosyltransferase involved in cell wall biosynthesis
MKIAHFGTFDVENYGDLLFPLLLEKRLGRNGIEFVHVSPVGQAPHLKDCKPTIGFREALAQCESWDAIVLGGGALAHGDTAGEVEKYRDPAIHTIAYPGLWLLPALISHLHGLPLVWNATGVPWEFSGERKRKTLQWACWQADYLAVRDIESARVLRELSINASVVPDTAVEVSGLWSAQELQQEFTRLHAAGRWPRDRYLALHLREWYVNSDPIRLAENIKQICDSQGAAALLMSVGGCHGDEAFASRIMEHLESYPASLFVPDSLRSVAAAIRHSVGYVGSSLHGAITAFSFARPFILVADQSRKKFSGFLAHIDAANLQVPDWTAAANAVSAWGKEQTGIDAQSRRQLARSLDEHWVSMSSALEKAKTIPAHIASRLLETLSHLPEEWFPLVPMLEQSPLFQPIFDHHRAPWTSARRHLQESAYLKAAAYDRLDQRHQKLSFTLADLNKQLDKLREDKRQTVEDFKRSIEQTKKAQQDQAKASEERLRAHLTVIHRHEGQVAELRKALDTHMATLVKRDEQIRERERRIGQLQEQLKGHLANVHRRDEQIAALHEELANSNQRNRVLKQGLRGIEQSFARLLASRSFHFMVYTARRFGLVSRTARVCVEAIKKQLADTHKALRQANKTHRGDRPSSGGTPARDAFSPPSLQTTSGPFQEPNRPKPALSNKSGDEVNKAVAEPTPSSSAITDAAMTSNRPSRSARRTFQQPPASRLPTALQADIVLCIHDALDDVRRCLASIVDHPTRHLNRLVLVNDGSDDQTTSYLRRFTAESQLRTVLLENPQPTGYTRAANQGLAGTEAGYVILLNSDTIVTPGWIDRLIACGESDPAVGIIGPLSNAASWQSVPERYSAPGDWAVNELPLTSLARIACAFSACHPPEYPKLPLINGFCFAIKRKVIDAIGHFDEALFPRGYGEENDYCLRAAKTGFASAVADDCYVFHAKSKSYSHETRRELARQSGAVLRQKYGAELDNATETLRNSPALERARSAFSRLLAAPPISILFLMHFRGFGGGVTSIVQEANGLRELGVAVQVAIRSEDESFYRYRFPTIPARIFFVYDSRAELLAYAGAFEIVVATLFTGVRILKDVTERYPNVSPCYYIQDYEPNFFPTGHPHYEEALESYTLIPTMHAFAKTRWLCETVRAKHGVPVHKVEPSIDRNIFFNADRELPHVPLVICAMVRPHTARRSPELTFEILRSIKLEFRAQVQIRIFGVKQDNPFLTERSADFEYEVLGILDREGVAQLLRGAFLFIDASTYQAFGRTGLEAMACGCATILPMEGGTTEYAIDGVNTLLAPPGDAAAVIANAKRYVEDREMHRRIVENALETASGYSIEGACLSELRFFESIRQKLNVNSPQIPAAPKVTVATV